MIEDLEEVAALEGWMLGSRTTARFMCELFRVEFQSIANDDVATLTAPLDFDELQVLTEGAPTPAVTRIITKPRIARGTDLDGYLAALEAEEDLRENIPTHARPSAPRLGNAVTA